jgi:hypothetical protein
MSFAATIQAANPEVPLDPDIIAQIEFLLVILTQHLQKQAIDLMTQFTRSGRLTLKEFQAAAQLVVPDIFLWVKPLLTQLWPRDYIRALLESCYPVEENVIDHIINIYSRILDYIRDGLRQSPNIRGLYLIVHSSEELFQLRRTLKWDVVGGGVMPFIPWQLYPTQRE